MLGIIGSVGLLGLTAAAVSAKISEPEHILYGEAFQAGVAAVPGAVITVTIPGSAVPVASYVLGSDPALGPPEVSSLFYALRVPMDSVDAVLPATPRPAATAREGDPASIFLDGELSARAVIGERGVAQLVDIDPANVSDPTLLSVLGPAILEGNSGQTAAVFTLSLAEPASGPVLVDWQTVNGTAISGSDYVAASGIATIEDGASQTTVVVQVLGDALEESDEKFSVAFSDPFNAVLARETVPGTILDDDSPPRMTITSVAVHEPVAPATESAVFRIEISRAWTSEVTVNYTTTAATATADLDYTFTSGLATIPIGALFAEVAVPILDDGEVGEPDEIFFLDLDTPSGATLVASRGQGSITEQGHFLTYVENEREGVAGVTGLGRAYAVAVSPGGDHVYAAGRDDNSLALFRRNTTSGALDFVEAYRNGVDGIEGLLRVEGVIVSGDGLNVYAAGSGDNAVATFARETDPLSYDYGRLTLIEVERDGVPDVGNPTVTVSGLGGASSFALSSDDLHLYVAGSSANAVAVFARNTTPGSAQFGALRFIDAEANGDPTGLPFRPNIIGLGAVSSLAVSPDGAHLYATGFSESAVVMFERIADPINPAFGSLRFVDLVQNGSGGVNELDGAVDVDISSDGAHVYVAAAAERDLVVFDRDIVDGGLTLASLTDAAPGEPALPIVSSLALSPDGQYLYSTGFDQDAVSVFQRNPGDGSLLFIESRLDNAEGVDGLRGALDVAVSADDQNVYVAGNLDNAVAVFTRDLSAPFAPLLSSPTHTVSVYSSNPVVAVGWQGAVDNPGGTGIKGYSFVFDQSFEGQPDEDVDLAHGADPHLVNSAPLPEGTNYFHLKACDRSDNCSSSVELGPLVLDLTAPTDPAAGSTSHTAGEASSNTVIDFTWAGASDALSGVGGFAVTVNTQASFTCPAVKNLEAAVNAFSTAPLPSGSYYFHLCTGDLAGNWTAGSALGPFVIVDGSPPQVIGVSSVAAPPGGVLTGSPVRAAITQLRVDMNKPLNTGLAAPASFQIVTPGPDQAIATLSCAAVAGDDILLPVAGVTAAGTGSSFAIKTGTQQGLTAGMYRLLACASSLEDLSGNQLDGNADGAAGDDFLLSFEVGLENQLANPNLDADLFSWTIEPPSADAQHRPDDADGAFSSGSARFAHDGGTELHGLWQCVDVAAGTPHVLKGRARVTAPAPLALLVKGSVQFLSGAGCSGSEVGYGETNERVADTTGLWSGLASNPIPAPGGAVSALVLFSAEAVGAGLVVEFDNLSFAPDTMTIFTDGFESGDLSGWSSVDGEVIP